MLIDLGLADFYLPNTRYNVRVASRHYKSPELLIGYEYYDYAIDMWGVGCILAGLLLRREPMFRGYVQYDNLLLGFDMLDNVGSFILTHSLCFMCF
jgi:casein kinase II subunit alpha